MGSQAGLDQTKASQKMTLELHRNEALRVWYLEEAAASLLVRIGPWVLIPDSR